MDDKKDRALDIPSEANRDKHINFPEAEERAANNESSDRDRACRSKEDETRREQWQKGRKEGEESRNNKR
jgi:hypothetical protein